MKPKSAGIAQEKCCHSKIAQAAASEVNGILITDDCLQISATSIIWICFPIAAGCMLLWQLLDWCASRLIVLLSVPSECIN